MSFKTIGTPVGSTLAASVVSTYTARLNANVSDQNGQLCDVRFGYDVHTHTNVADYANQTAWVYDTYATGSYPYADITSLTASQTYYFRVIITNDAGSVTGSELTFATNSGVFEPTSVTAIPSSNSINLSWVKNGSNQTWIRYAEGSFPTTTGGGSSAYAGTGSSYELTGLTPGKVYNFSLWGLTSGVYSASYITVLSTTTAYSIPTTTPAITLPAGKFNPTPSGIKLSSTPILGAIVTSFSTSYGMGETYIWYLFWFLAGAGIFILVYQLTHQNDILTGLVTAGWFGLGAAQELLGLVVIVLILIVWSSTSIVGRNRV